MFERIKEFFVEHSIKFLSLLCGCLIWFSVVSREEARTEIELPVRIMHLQDNMAGKSLAGNLAHAIGRQCHKPDKSKAKPFREAGDKFKRYAFGIFQNIQRPHKPCFAKHTGHKDVVPFANKSFKRGVGCENRAKNPCASKF